MMNNYDTPVHGGKSKRKNTDPDMSELVDMFGEMTSSLYVLGVKLKGFHWNVVGNQFFPLHVVLDEQVDALFCFADGAAEIIRQLDINMPAPVNMLTMVKRSFINETRTSGLINAEVFLPVIVSDYSEMISYCCKLTKMADKAGRQDISDFAIKVRQHLDKYKWQFESALK